MQFSGIKASQSMPDFQTMILLETYFQRGISV